MNRNDVLTLIAAQIKADPQALMAFAAEDTLGGYHWNEAQRTFPSGSLWQVEGQILYALVRWLKPMNVVEIGGWAGASASHLALAVQANGVGHVTSVDSGIGGQEHGHLLTPELRKSVTLVNREGVEWLLDQSPASIGFLFEDADHSTALVRSLTEAALPRMEPGGIIANHDAAHDFAYIGGGVKINSEVGRAVRDGLALANVYFKPYLADPSDCGLAITLIPGIRNLDVHSTKPLTVETSKPMSLDELKKALQGLSPEEVKELLQNVRPLPEPQAMKADDSPLVGNANIESQSEPPPPKQMLSPNEKGFKTEPTITYNPQLVEEIKKQVEQPKSKRPTKAK